MFESMGKQQKILDLWKEKENISEMDKEQQSILRAMDMHPQYRDIWESKNIYDAMERQGNENVFFHVIMHSIIQNQIDDKKPPIVSQAFEHLTKKGLAPHEAQHSLMIILADEISDTMRNRVPFDNKRYVARIQKFLKD